MKMSPGVLTAAFLLSTLTGFAAPKFNVSVEVSGDATNEISSFLTRELRELPDVAIAQPGEAEYEISIVSLKISVAGKPNGYALSILATSRIDASAWSFVVSSNELSVVQGITKDLRTVELQEIKILPPDGLKAICQSIVADMDRTILERQRKLVDQLLKMSTTNAPSKRLENYEPGQLSTRKTLKL
jgi:hypothetical protein